LEAEQLPATDSVKLLEEEIEREELRIEQKRQLLADLEENAKTASQKQKKRAKAVCFPVLFVEFLPADKLNRLIHYCKILPLQLVTQTMLRVLNLRNVEPGRQCLMRRMRI
jgi:hypothetical protein